MEKVTVLDQARAGNNAELVVGGEPGIGTTAWLGYAAGRALCLRVISACGVESEMELAFAGLHQLRLPMLGRLEQLPKPQRNALAVAFGMRRARLFATRQSGDLMSWPTRPV